MIDEKSPRFVVVILHFVAHTGKLGAYRRSWAHHWQGPEITRASETVTMVVFKIWSAEPQSFRTIHDPASFQGRRTGFLDPACDLAEIACTQVQVDGVTSAPTRSSSMPFHELQGLLQNNNRSVQFL